jgi:uncharacterized protein YbcC (UPF0753/DUF2309 family)
MNRPDHSAAVDLACKAIAPSWPLDQQIAVNPYWGFVDRSFADAAATLRTLLGSRMALHARDYQRAWHCGEITAAALRAAILQHGATLTIESAVAALQGAHGEFRGLPLLSDTLDPDPLRASAPLWRETITQQISQYCASHFDQHQADWHRPRENGLFAGWRSGLHVDHALQSLMHAPEIRARSRELPANAEQAIQWALDRIQVPEEEVTKLMQLCLLRINGWASWCAYLAWQADQCGTSDSHLRELLAIRLCWEVLLDDGRRDADSIWWLWRRQWQRGLQPPQVEAVEQIWQRAHELTYQQRLFEQLSAVRADVTPVPATARPAAQMVFCIDVRSERFRRNVESVDPAIETRGFAGFFGLPISYKPVGTTLSRPQLPGLLAPSIEITDTTGDADLDKSIVRKRQAALRSQSALLPFLRLPTGAFSLVETLGLGYLGALVRKHLGDRGARVESLGLEQSASKSLRPHLCSNHENRADQRAELVESILRAMSLTSGFARLLVLVGHGSQSSNNPQSAALDCGACGGQTGEVNARVLADLINHAGIRAALSRRGIEILPDTVAVAALHNTTTDEIEFFDMARLPDSHAHEIATLQQTLAAAGCRTRAERAPSLGLAMAGGSEKALLKAVRRRARDWAQTRPEWGLAGNAAFIVAPRARTLGLDLAGRTFLHDYCWEQDHDGKVLELIMTAPMVVTHWINLQYLASTVDPDRFGSGNKLLHNVACGRIGVFEGNTGDLRIGLARQSVHDGKGWMHAPLRLSVVIDAPRHRIEMVLNKHATVRHLVVNQWLYLFRLDHCGVEQYEAGGWRDAAPFTPP